MSTQRRMNRLRAVSGALVVGLVLVPLAVAFAIDPQQASQPSAGAHTAVLRGRVTNEAGAPLAGVRLRVAIPATDMRFVDTATERKLVEGTLDHKLHKLLEARTDAAGDYRLEISGIGARTPVSIDAIKPGYRRLAGLMMSRDESRTVEVAPGRAAEAPLILGPALHLSGIVVDEHGKPIPGVKIWANEAFGTAGAGVESTTSRSDGSFELFNFPVTSRVIQNEKTRGVVGFGHRDYVQQEIEDIYAIAPDRREALRIILGKGHIVAGTVIDAVGKPVPNALVKIARDGFMTDKVTMTDANGKFALRGLGKDLTLLHARALENQQAVEMRIADDGDLNDLQVRLKPIPLTPDMKKYTVLGMQLTDVTPELKSAYDTHFDAGAVILDPGKDSDRLNIGKLAEGYCFWMVGHKQIGSVREFVDQILTEAIGENAAKNAVHGVPVIYRFCTVKGDGNMTQYLKLSKEELGQLQILSDQLRAESE